MCESKPLRAKNQVTRDTFFFVKIYIVRPLAAPTFVKTSRRVCLDWRRNHKHVFCTSKLSWCWGVFLGEVSSVGVDGAETS